MVLLYSIGSNPDHTKIDEQGLLSMVFELGLQQNYTECLCYKRFDV